MKFDMPIVISTGGDIPPVELKSVADVWRWSTEQSQYWVKAREALRKTSVEAKGLERILEEQCQEWYGLSLHSPGAGGKQVDQDHFKRRIHNSVAERRLLMADDPVVRRALALVPVDPPLAEFLLKVANGRLLSDIEKEKNSADFLYNYARAVASLTSTKDQAGMIERCREGAETVRALTRKSRSEHEAVLVWAKDTRGRLEEMIAAIKISAEERLAEIDAEWARLRAVYDTSLKLEAPRKYWDAKRETHAAQAIGWRNAFAAFAIAGAMLIGAAVAVLPNLVELYAKHSGSQAWIAPAVLLGVPAFLVLWLLRICGRQWSDHLIRQEDARERVAMVETFLALSRNEESPSTVADATHLAIILGALFRAGPGLSQDDAPPVGIVEVLKAKLGGARST